jgi:4-aminobutyrate aminotransferase
VFFIPFPFWHQFSLPPTTSEDDLVKQSLYQLNLRLKQQTAPGDTAAVIVEPVLGEGGYVPAPHAFLRGLRDICDQHGILLIIDEVQCGFGRTGKLFNIEYSAVKPDIMVMAKVIIQLKRGPQETLTFHHQGLANGFPLSCVASRKELTDKLKPGSMVRCSFFGLRSVVTHDM